MSIWVAVRINNPEPDVDRMLAVLGLYQKRDSIITVESLDPTLAKVPFPVPTTYEAVFRHYLDISAHASRQSIGALAKYAPSEEHPDLDFSEKQSTLFWRGATSEGVSHGNVDQWRGMTRQRFIHLANDINGTNPDMPLLLPSEKIPGMLEYKYFPISTLTTLLATDVHVVDGIARCFGRDCEDQAREFAPLVPPSDFQDHWKYKYLLDLDGAGFSGRFLPFLQSKSLPFKAALFREWWDDRVTPWVHFVPLDLRGHGFWATLAYFAGIDATSANGKELKEPARQKEAERIATEGKKWAETVLRKEDMEIYFFRLLLEWARLTDDKRDVLGFALE